MTGRSVVECQTGYLRLSMAILYQRRNPQLPENVTGGDRYNLNNYGKLR